MYPSANRTVFVVVRIEPGCAICSMRAARCARLTNDSVFHIKIFTDGTDDISPGSAQREF